MQRKSMKSGCCSIIEVLMQCIDVEPLDDSVDEVYESLRRAWNIEQGEQRETTQGGVEHQLD